MKAVGLLMKAIGLLMKAIGLLMKAIGLLMKAIGRLMKAINEKNTTYTSLYYENRFITDFKEKAKLFNCFFSKQCSLLANHTELPTSLSFRTDK